MTPKQQANFPQRKFWLPACWGGVIHGPDKEDGRSGSACCTCDPRTPRPLSRAEDDAAKKAIAELVRLAPKGKKEAWLEAIWYALSDERHKAGKGGG